MLSNLRAVATNGNQAPIHLSNTSIYLAPNRRGTGLGVYAYRDIQHRIISTESHYGKCEIIFIDVNVNGTALAGVVYLPKRNVHIFESTVSNICEKYNNISVVGDFNNELYDRVKALRMRFLCDRLNISLQHNALPTHFQMLSTHRPFWFVFLYTGQPTLYTEITTLFLIKMVIDIIITYRHTSQIF
uniref:Endonuclease/exonuclease/phosphatase domain-containing protein n=1 Tax=Glossina pallidipes TaxID=7398 RepID=A0A1B0AED1_GLOPL